MKQVIKVNDGRLDSRITYISIKDKYFDKHISNWKYTLNNLIYNVNDSTNTYTLTASGDLFYISDNVNNITH